MTNSARKILTLNPKRFTQLKAFARFRTSEIKEILKVNKSLGKVSLKGKELEAFKMYKASASKDVKEALNKLWGRDFAAITNGRINSFTPPAGSVFITPKGNTVMYLWKNEVLTSSGKIYTKMPKQLSEGYEFASYADIEAYFNCLKKKLKKNPSGNYVLPKVIPAMTTMRIRAMG